MVSPPLRDGVHQAALWQGLAEGSLDIVSTDHNPRHRQQPASGALPFHPPGAASIETRLALMHTFGVRAGRISLTRWVDACCTRPAQIFGLSRKGQLRPNCDADLVVFDPNQEVVFTPNRLHSSIDFSTYDGLRVTGFPAMTISRGEIIVEGGQFTGRPGRGRFVERSY